MRRRYNIYLILIYIIFSTTKVNSQQLANQQLMIDSLTNEETLRIKKNESMLNTILNNKNQYLCKENYIFRALNYDKIITERNDRLKEYLKVKNNTKSILYANLLNR